MAAGMGSMRGQMRGLRADRSIVHQKLAPGTVRRIYAFSAGYRKMLAVFLGLVVIDAAVATVNPLIYRAILDDGIGKGGHKGIVVTLALVLGALAIFDVALGVVERMISSRIGQGLIFDMRSRVFAHISEMSVAFFTRVQTGALVSRLNSDVQGAQQAFTDVLQNVVSNFVTVVLVVTAMLVLSWQITIAALVLLPIFVYPARRVGRRLQQITREAYGLNAELTTMMTERFNVSGALLVKIFGHPVVERATFDTRAGRVRDIYITQAMYARFFFAAVSLTGTLAVALVYGWGGILVIDHKFPIGTVVALIAYLTKLYGPLTGLANVQIDVMTALVSFDRVFEVLDLPPLVAEAPDAIELGHGNLDVVFDHVNFSYPGAEEVSLASLESVAVLERHDPVSVLHDVSFRVPPGSLVALVGHSGAGKTTIGQLVPRLYDATSGSVRIGGTDLRQAKADSLRSVVGVVSQDAHLFHDTIRANLLYARPDADDGALRSALAGAQVLDLVDSLPDGLDTVVGDRGYRLSGGEKQRIAIARLLLKGPEIVVLDEATAHLDSESEFAVQRALDTALAGRTSIVIAHRLSTIRNADEILVIEGGRVVERGRHGALLASGGLYAELYEAQFAQTDEGDDPSGPPEV